MADNGKGVIFTSRCSSPAVEGVAIQTGLLPGMVVEQAATGFNKYANDGSTDGLQCLIVDKNFLIGGSLVTDAYTQLDTVVARQLAKGETANVLVSAGNNITKRGMPITTDSADGYCKIATPATETVRFYTDEIINVTGSAALVRVVGA